MPTNEEIASSYGWSLAVINSSSELKHLFATAKSKHYTTAQFVARLRDTRWYRRHSESWRQMKVLEKADPAEFRQRMNQTHATLRDQAKTMGARLNDRQLAWLSRQAQFFGWNDAEIKDHLSRYVKFWNGRLVGQAGVDAANIRATALANGFSLTDKRTGVWARQIARGGNSVENLQNYIREQTAKSFPSFAKELKAGVDLQEIAAPYTQAMATLWEQLPGEITMFNPTIRRALARRHPKDGTPWAMSTTDFEDMLRKDNRWLQTQNAQDAGMSVVHDLLRQWGMVAS